MLIGNKLISVHRITVGQQIFVLLIREIHNLTYMTFHMAQQNRLNFKRLRANKAHPISLIRVSDSMRFQWSLRIKCLSAYIAYEVWIVLWKWQIAKLADFYPLFFQWSQYTYMNSTVRTQVCHVALHFHGHYHFVFFRWSSFTNLKKFRSKTNN